LERYGFKIPNTYFMPIPLAERKKLK